jgi:hypothetical protein
LIPNALTTLYFLPNLQLNFLCVLRMFQISLFGPIVLKIKDFEGELPQQSIPFQYAVIRFMFVYLGNYLLFVCGKNKDFEEEFLNN